MRKQPVQEDKIQWLKDDEKKLWIVDMACPNEKNIGKKQSESSSKYQQLVFKIQETTHRDWLFAQRNEASGIPDEKNHKGR